MDVTVSDAAVPDVVTVEWFKENTFLPPVPIIEREWDDKPDRVEVESARFYSKTDTSGEFYAESEWQCPSCTWRYVEAWRNPADVGGYDMDCKCGAKLSLKLP